MRKSEELLRKCMAMDASDGRPYVSLGKVLVQQKRFDEARKLYEDGAAVTGQCVASASPAYASSSLLAHLICTYLTIVKFSPIAIEAICYDLRVCAA